MNTERERKSPDKGKAYPRKEDESRTEKERHAPGRGDERKADKVNDGRQRQQDRVPKVG